LSNENAQLNNDAIMSKETEKIWEEYIGLYAESILNNIESINTLGRSSSYSPYMGQNIMQSVNMNPKIPTQANLTTWLTNPSKHQKNLRDASTWLEGAIMQYRRTVDHFAKILTFNQEVTSSTSPQNAKEKKTFKNSYNRCMDYSRKFNLKYQKDIILKKIMRDGGMYSYFVEDDNFINMIEVPSDYAYITGRWQWGWTYAVDLTWFDRLVGAEETMPEMYEYYKIFVAMRTSGLQDAQLAKFQYYAVPVEDGYYFAFDVLVAQNIPPFGGIFKDALEIDTYKRLLKQKSALDTWKVIAQEIPLDGNGKPQIPVKLAQRFIELTQGVIPKGTTTFSTPMKVKELNFSNSQNQNSITGMGEQLFWRSIGVNGSLMDLGDKSAASLRLSLINDGAFVEHIYRQFENYINLHFLIISRKFIFNLKLFGNRYTDAEDMKKYADLVTTANMPVGKLFGYAGYEPHEVIPTLQMENLFEIKDLMTPLISQFQQSPEEKAGAKKKDEGNLTEAGETQRDQDSNLESGKTDAGG